MSENDVAPTTPSPHDHVEAVPSRAVISDVFRSYRSTWKTLALTDVVYKIVAFIVLVPLVGILFRVLLAVSGNTLLADQDILFFFLGPVGWLCAIAVGGLWLAIVALEQAALMGVLFADQGQRRMRVTEALRFALVRAWPVIKVTARMVAFTLLASLPALALVGVTYIWLLGDYDINFYLAQKPPEFLMALGIAGVIVLVLATVLLRLFTGWFFALQLVLFEDVPSAKALRTSGERSRGRRRRIVVWIIGWGLASMLLSAVTTSLVVWIGHLIVPGTTTSLWWLAATVGLTMALLSVVGLVVNLVSTTFFAAILFQLYRHLGSDGRFDLSRLDVSETTAVARFRITRTRLAVGAVLGAAVALGTGFVALHSVRLDDQVHIIAHRGSSKAAPENTMAAVEQAIADGTDWVEIDVQETKDGEVVVFHDSDFMKLANVNLKIWDATTEDLKDIDVGTWFAPEFKDERVPTLAEVLEECRGKAGVNIELKYYGHDVDLEQRVVDIVEAQGMEQEVVFMSLKADKVQKLQKLRPEWTVGLLMSVSAGDLESIKADFLAVNAGFADRSFIRSARGMGKDVAVWTVNDAPTMSSMISRGVDGLITDKPALARSVLEQRAQMSPVERLLLEVASLLGTEPEIGEQ